MGDSAQKLIAYVGPFAFPNGGAAARRILGNCLTLKSLGYRVIIGSGQMPESDGGVHDEFEGLDVQSLGERTVEHYPRLLKHLFYLKMGARTRLWLESLKTEPSAVVLYSGYSPYFRQLLPFCRARGIPLIFDAVEWYEAPSVLQQYLSPYQLNIELAMRHYCVEAGNLIAISSWLEDYYRQRSCNLVRIPPTLDTHAIEPNLAVSNDSSLTIGYTGQPGRKDLFDNYLEALHLIDPRGEHVRFRVAGVTEEGLRAYPAIKKRGSGQVPNGIQTMGMTSHAQATALIRGADFSVLLRPDRRYAQAGFPTKVVESLSYGTPVIANITSDLGECLRDKEQGLVCKDETAQSLADGLERALLLSPEQRRDMRREARVTAEALFDYRNYREPLSAFLATLNIQETR